MCLHKVGGGGEVFTSPNPLQSQLVALEFFDQLPDVDAVGAGDVAVYQLGQRGIDVFVSI